MGACKSCNAQKEDAQTTIENHPINPSIKCQIINEIKQVLGTNNFNEYQLIKHTKYSFEYNATFRTVAVKKSKKINTLGKIKPIDLEGTCKVNEELKTIKANNISEIQIEDSMHFKCGLQIGDTFPNIQLNNLKTQNLERLEFKPNEYTLIRSWSQGELMFNFEQAIELVQEISSTNKPLRLIGFVRGKDPDYYKEIVISNNGWDNYTHYILNQDQPQIDQAQIFDTYFNEETNEVEENQIMSALLFKGDQLIWKRYVHEWEMTSDCDEVSEDVKKALQQQQSMQQKQIENQSKLSVQEYRDLKYFILAQKENKQYTRNLTVTINKKVIYQQADKKVIIDEPQILIQCSPKSESITNTLYKSIACRDKLQIKNNVWNSKVLKSKLQDLIGQHKINVVACLEKSIRLKINWENCITEITPWEQGNFVAYYPSTTYISQVKQWIIVREEILPYLEEQIKMENQSKIDKRINEMLFQFFSGIPMVDKVLNQEYGKIPYAEKRKPPYEDLSVSKSLGNEEIARKQNQILFILLIDYENDDTLNYLKQLINYKLTKPLQTLQIAVLGHIRAESWTKIFQAFMEKHELKQYAEDGTIETWFPIEDKIKSISFSAILSKMYGLQLEKRDCLIIDLQNRVRVIDSSRKVIPNVDQVMKSLDQDPQVIVDKFNYIKQWSAMKKILINNPQIEQICQKLKNQCRDDDWMISVEMKQQKQWQIEGNSMKETKKHNQPIRQVKGFKGIAELDELSTIIQKQIDPRDFIALS